MDTMYGLIIFGDTSSANELALSLCKIDSSKLLPPLNIILGDANQSSNAFMRQQEHHMGLNVVNMTHMESVATKTHAVQVAFNANHTDADKKPSIVNSYVC